MTKKDDRPASEGMPVFYIKCWAIVRTEEIKNGKLPEHVITGGLVYQQVPSVKKKLKKSVMVFVPSGWLALIMGGSKAYSRLELDGIVDDQELKALKKLFHNADNLPISINGSTVKYRIPKTIKTAGKILLEEIRK